MHAQDNRIDQTDIVTTRQAAAMLGVAVSTVQKWVELGKLGSWKTPGGHRRISRAAIHAVLQGSADAPTALAAAAQAVLREDRATGATAAALPAGLAPMDEATRLRATRATGLFDTPAHAHYDRIVRVAALLTNMPIALISLLDKERQWFKSRIGMSITETPRSWAFCHYTVMDQNIMVIEDATRDPRFAANPLVTGYESIRFYAGVPLVDGNGCRLGTLCVLDRVPRQLTHDQAWALTELANLVSEEIQRTSMAPA